MEVKLLKKFAKFKITYFFSADSAKVISPSPARISQLLKKPPSLPTLNVLQPLILNRQFLYTIKIKFHAQLNIGTISINNQRI